MASVEFSDETVIAARREVIAAAVSDRSRWVAWWPELELAVVLDRGLSGIRWSVAGPLVGTSEVILVEQQDAVLVRYALTADPTEPGSRTTPRRIPDSPRGRRELDSLERRHVVTWKSVVWALKDEFEAGS